MQVIQVTEDERQATCDSVHHALEAATCVLEAKCHHQELTQAKGSNHCCFGNVVFAHGDLPVALPQLDLGEDAASVEPVCEVQSGYWSGSVTRLSRLKLPQGRQELSFLATM